MQDPTVYFINCAKHKDRLKTFKKTNKHIHSKRVPCVNGKKFTKRVLTDMVDHGVIEPNTKLTKIETSIVLSHFKAMQRFLNTKHEMAIICEDDVTFKSRFYEKLRRIVREVPEFDVLYLYNGDIYKTHSKLKRVKKINDKIKVSKETVKHNPSGVCYLIKRRLTEHVLKTSFPFKRAFDTILGTISYSKKFNYYTLNMTSDWGSDLVKTEPWDPSQSTQELDDDCKAKNPMDYVKNVLRS